MEQSHDDNLDGGHRGREDQAGVVRVRHDRGADQPGRHAPRCGPHILEIASLFGLVLHIEGLGKVLPQEVRSAGLDGHAILRQRLNRVRLVGAREALAVGLPSGEQRQAQLLLREPHVHVEDLPRLCLCLLFRGVGCVALLPQELRAPQEGLRPAFPTHDVHPLVHPHRQIPVTLDPLPVHVPDDGLRRGPHDVRVGELAVWVHLDAGRGLAVLARDLHRPQAVVRDDGALRGEALDVGGFLGQEADWDQQREIRVLDRQALEFRIEKPLDVLPDSEARRPQDLAPAHGGIVDKVRPVDDVDVPLVVVLRPRCNLQCLLLHRGLGLLALLLLLLLVVFLLGGGGREPRPQGPRPAPLRRADEGWA
mmetsp:Transcript_103338/g.316259  ORF Transcript_103338/g.316259 Transcript_103338/m.316259 type:complete len:365 (-) Transcript_103338:65-1159(-)